MSPPSSPPGADHKTAHTSRDGLILAALILVLTAAIAIAWSHAKLLSQDEMFVLQTDSVHSVRELIRIQRHYPISLDPLVYHLLAHACTKLFGVTALALRLPSIFGFLLMQLSIFLATRRITGPSSEARAALIAMAFPAFTATLFYAPEARPYGLLLGFYALAFLAWQSATRATPPHAAHNPGAPRLDSETWVAARTTKLSFHSRTLPLILLSLAIALTLNSHYFGILILIPICLAELARTEQRRKFDLPVIAAILIGMASIVFTLPFQRAAGEFRKHYYNAGAITIRAVSQAYRSLFVSYSTQRVATQRIEDILLVLFAIAVIALCIVRLHRGEVTIPAPELIFLLTLAALPLFGVALALFVTHSIEVRYVLSAVIAVAIFFAIAIEPSLRNRLSPTATTTLLLIGILAAGVIRIRDEQAKSNEQLALLIYAWNAFREDRVLSRLQLPKGGLTSRNFPEPR